MAGQQIFEEGIEKGIEKGVMKDARDMVIEALKERFVAVPSGIRDEVYSVGQHEAMKELLRYAIRSSDIEEFRKVLSKVSSAS
ncbi:MAG: hypothetical protein GY749_46665 [Desulfobacteraceae bacterium]|nr:hypothetical protein [Desulfobacteraceae bacterium]